jgi:hypothetical protein
MRLVHYRFAAVTIYLATVMALWLWLDLNIFIAIFSAAAVLGFFTAVSAPWWNNFDD